MSLTNRLINDRFLIDVRHGVPTISIVVGLKIIVYHVSCKKSSHNFLHSPVKKGSNCCVRQGVSYTRFNTIIGYGFPMFRSNICLTQYVSTASS